MIRLRRETGGSSVRPYRVSAMQEIVKGGEIRKDRPYKIRAVLRRSAGKPKEKRGKLKVIKE